jgi:hypothetical protein
MGSLNLNIIYLATCFGSSKAIKRPTELLHAREIMYFGTVKSIFVAEMLMLKIFVQRRSSSLW